MKRTRLSPDERAKAQPGSRSVGEGQGHTARMHVCEESHSGIVCPKEPFGENWSGVLEPITKPANDQWFHDPTLFEAEDFEKFKQSGLTIIHTGTAFPLPNPYEVALKYFASWNGLIAHHNDWLMRIDNPERLDNVKHLGKLGIILGMQNSDHGA